MQILESVLIGAAGGLLWPAYQVARIWAEYLFVTKPLDRVWYRRQMLIAIPPKAWLYAPELATDYPIAAWLMEDPEAAIIAANKEDYDAPL